MAFIIDGTCCFSWSIFSVSYPGLRIHTNLYGSGSDFSFHGSFISMVPKHRFFKKNERIQKCDFLKFNCKTFSNYFFFIPSHLTSLFLLVEHCTWQSFYTSTIFDLTIILLVLVIPVYTYVKKMLNDQIEKYKILPKTAVTLHLPMTQHSLPESPQPGKPLGVDSTLTRTALSLTHRCPIDSRQFDRSACLSFYVFF